jgi:hypothetical protein
MLWVQKPKGPNSVKPSRQDMLQEPTQEFMSRKRHHLGSVVAMTSIPKRNGSLGTGDDGAI